MSYLNTTNEAILSEINNVVEQWRGLFDNPPEKSPVIFSINAAGMLCANGIVLFPVRNILVDSLSFDIDVFYIRTNEGEEFEIGINWPFSGHPYVTYIQKKTLLFSSL